MKINIVGRLMIMGELVECRSFELVPPHNSIVYSLFFHWEKLAEEESNKQHHNGKDVALVKIYDLYAYMCIHIITTHFCEWEAILFLTHITFTTDGWLQQIERGEGMNY